MNWWRWIRETNGAPHSRAFYGFIVVLGLMGVACSLALSVNSDASLAWCMAFAGPSAFFLLGVAQAVERLGWPEQAGGRSADLSGVLRSQILLARFAVLAVSLGGCILAAIAQILADPERQDFYDNLRILCFLLIFICFCLADLAGDETFPTSMWLTAWRAIAGNLGRKPKLRRRRRSLY